MRRIDFFAKKKKPAQAMVEFALVLPILLLLLYGILETGRFLFIYSTVVTASRQAVRFGSATGTSSAGILRYRDCAGMRAEAQKVDYLNAFDDADIRIYHDDGPNLPSTDGLNMQEYCTGTVDSTFTPSYLNTQRIVVRIDGDFNPLVPKLIPFIRRTVETGNPITSISRRTIIASVTIQVTAPPSSWSAPTPTNVSTCNQISVVSSGSPPRIKPSGTTMYAQVTNNNDFPVKIEIVEAQWNDNGHTSGGSKKLDLTQVELGSTVLPVSANGGSATIIPSTVLNIPANTTANITFTFHQTYDTFNGSEWIKLSFKSVPGCTFNPLVVTN